MCGCLLAVAVAIQGSRTVMFWSLFPVNKLKRAITKLKLQTTFLQVQVLDKHHPSSPPSDSPIPLLEIKVIYFYIQYCIVSYTNKIKKSMLCS